MLSKISVVAFVLVSFLIAENPAQAQAYRYTCGVKSSTGALGTTHFDLTFEEGTPDSARGYVMKDSAGNRVSQVSASVGNFIVGFAGMKGSYFGDEYSRGIDLMPSSSAVEAIRVQIWEKYGSADSDWRVALETSVVAGSVIRPIVLMLPGNAYLPPNLVVACDSSELAAGQ
jgi:hypothetical protein